MSYIAAFVFNQDLEADDDLSKYILQASLDGRLKTNEGNLSATGDLCTVTAASGKDLYFTAAKCVIYNNGGSTGTGNTKIELRVNNVVIETFQTNENTDTIEYEFVNIGHKVANTDGTPNIKLQVIAIIGDVDVEGTIQAIEVPSGENPVTYTGS